MSSLKTERAEAEVAAERLPAIAEMVANGEVPTPANLPGDHLPRLLELMHTARRRELVRLIVRAIARDICRNERQREHHEDVN